MPDSFGTYIIGIFHSGVLQEAVKSLSHTLRTPGNDLVLNTIVQLLEDAGKVTLPEGCYLAWDWRANTTNRL